MKYYIKAEEFGFPFLWNNIGLHYNSIGEYKLAEQYFLKGVDNDCDYSKMNLALLYKNNNDIDNAIKYYIIASKNIPQALIEIARLYKESGYYENSIYYYNEYIKKDNTFDINNELTDVTNLKESTNNYKKIKLLRL